MVHRELTTLEAVALAVRSEMESTDLYGKLTKRVKNPEVVAMLLDLQQEEEHHREALMDLYRSMLKGEEASIPESDGRDKVWDIDPEADFLTIMTKARDKEFDSEIFYQEAAKRVRDHKTRTFFMDLAETERKHAARLQVQVDRLKQDPHWFERTETAFHEGP